MEVSDALELVQEAAARQSDVRDMMENVGNKLADKLDIQVLQIAEELLIAIMENLEDNHKISFLCEEPHVPKLISMMDDEGVQEAFKAVIIQFATIAPTVQSTSKALVIDEKTIAPVVKFMAT